MNDDRDELQRRYATWLERGTRIGFVLLVASFVAVLLGALPTGLSPDQLAAAWSLPADEFLRRSGSGTGWAGFMARPPGDAVALLGILWLAACSLPCLAAVLPAAWRRGDRRLAALCAAELLVIVFAASGWFVGGL